MSATDAVIELAPPELPTSKCSNCGGTLRLIAYDRDGKPLFACSTPSCDRNWTAQRKSA
jgi:hypothetical protein